LTTSDQVAISTTSGGKLLENMENPRKCLCFFMFHVPSEFTVLFQGPAIGTTPWQCNRGHWTPQSMYCGRVPKTMPKHRSTVHDCTVPLDHANPFGYKFCTKFPNFKGVEINLGIRPCASFAFPGPCLSLPGTAIRCNSASTQQASLRVI
jgi:hypothetical protein